MMTASPTWTLQEQFRHEQLHQESQQTNTQKQRQTSPTIPSRPQARLLHHLSHLSHLHTMSHNISLTSHGPAPWRQPFLDSISLLDPPKFVLSTLHRNPDPRAPTPYVPRARYVIYRGMFASPKLNSKYPHQAVPPNPDVYDSDMPTFTTDARMDKVPDLFASGPGHGEPSQSSGSGGGGAVEAVFWIKEVGKQWRIRGEAYVLAPDVEGPSEESSGVRTLKSRVGERLRVVDESQRDNWSWKKELDTQFMNLAPGMRGSFRNPPPGTPVKQPVPEGKELGQKVNDVGDELARNNFRVVIIRPEVVECVDMKDPATARRWRYTFVGNVGGEGVEDGWRKEELWP